MIDPECLKQVNLEYSKLQGAIGDLGTSIGNTLGRQKQDIQRLNSSEMRTVQVEIEALRKEKNRLEESIATNERACQLETERDWYKREALHLDEVLNDTQNKQKNLEDRLDETEQDRKWLKGQVEKTTKHNRVLLSKLKEVGVDVSALREREDGGDLNEKTSSEETEEVEEIEDKEKAADSTVEYVTENADATEVQHVE